MGKFKLEISNDKVIEIEGYSEGELLNVLKATFKLLNENEIAKHENTKHNTDTDNKLALLNEIKTNSVREDVTKDTNNKSVPRMTSNFMCPSCKQSTFIADRNSDTVIIRIIEQEGEEGLEQLKSRLYVLDRDIDSLKDELKDTPPKDIEKRFISVLNEKKVTCGSLFDFSNISDHKDVNLYCPICGEEHGTQEFIDMYKQNHILGLCKYCGKKNEEQKIDKDGNIIENHVCNFE